MTTATVALTELAEKGADIDQLRQMIRFMAQRLVELDARLGARRPDAVPHRLGGHRNDVRPGLGRRGAHAVANPVRSIARQVSQTWRVDGRGPRTTCSHL